MKILHLSITLFASMLLMYESYATTFASSEAKICLTDFSNATACDNAIYGEAQIDRQNQWSFTCQLGGSSLDFKGLAFCASEEASPGTVADTISSGPYDNLPENCWCKMTYPFASKWVSAGQAGGGKYYCFNMCASYCKSALSQNDSYNPMRTLMLTNPENQ